MPNFDNDERLEAIMAVCNELNLKVTYIHEDIVFVEHNNFLFQLDAQDDAATRVRFNQECKPAEVMAYGENLQNAAAKQPGLKLTISGSYTLVAGAEGEMQLQLQD